MHPVFVDVENELTEIELEVGHLSVKLSGLDPHQVPASAQDEWETSSVCASAAEKIYTGCERVMARIASGVDGVPVSQTESWHSAIIRRMANGYPGVRGPVISHECHALLDKLRSFRHRERNTYGMNLDYEIVVRRAREAITGFGLFKRDVIMFFRQTSGADVPAGNR